MFGMMLEIFIYWLYSKVLIIRYGLSWKCHMIVLSDDDWELDYYAMKHVEDYIKRFYLKRVIIVSTSRDELPEWIEMKTNIVKLCKISHKKMNRIKQVVRMHGAYIKTIALDFPKEKMNRYIVGMNGLTKEDIVCRAEYQLFFYKAVGPYEKSI